MRIITIKFFPLLATGMFRSACLIIGLNCCFEPSKVISAPTPAAGKLSAVRHKVRVELLGQKPIFSNPVDLQHRIIYFDIQGSLICAFVILLSSLGAAAIGFRLQRTSSFASLTDEQRSASRAAINLTTILTAIVIGVVADDSIRTFNQANDSIQGLAIDTLTLDNVLENYGPETFSMRKQLRDDIRYRITRIQSMESYTAADYQAIRGLPRIELLFREVVSLKPKTEIQKELRTRAIALIGGTTSFGSRGNMAQKRWLFTVGDAKAPRPVYLLVIFSLTLEFLCFGLLAKPHRITYLLTALAGMVVASTMLVVVELDNPMDGFFTVLVEPLQKAELLLNQ